MCVCVFVCGIQCGSAKQRQASNFVHIITALDNGLSVASTLEYIRGSVFWDLACAQMQTRHYIHFVCQKRLAIVSFLLFLFILGWFAVLILFFLHNLHSNMSQRRILSSSCMYFGTLFLYFLMNLRITVSFMATLGIFVCLYLCRC